MIGVVATMFGVAASLGLGTIQFNAGLAFTIVLLLCISIWRAVELEGATRDPRPAPTDA